MSSIFSFDSSEHFFLPDGGSSVKMEITDDKPEHCIPFLLRRLEAHQQKHGARAPPFFLGLNGVQGVGKTTLVGCFTVNRLS